MSSTEIPALFQPVQIGDIQLAHRVVLAPMTRLRADAQHVPTDLTLEFYDQRSKFPGTLLISEGVNISHRAFGLPHTPGIWNNEQITAWKKITDAVHANGSYIYAQLWAFGRGARTDVLKNEDASFDKVGPSPIALKESPDDVPRELTTDEIKQYIKWYGVAAANAVNLAGFDGVEVHGANGYLVDQFIQDVSNKRTDGYGGSIKNRARFALEVMQSIVDAVGQKKSALRLSPWAQYQDMRMEDPVPTFTYIVEQLKERFPELAYLHVVSPNTVYNRGPKDETTADFIYRLWTPRRTITTGGFTRESALKTAQESGQLIGFGVGFLANPDLPFRLRKNLSLNEADHSAFYVPMQVKGYTDYAFSQEFLAAQA